MGDSRSFRDAFSLRKTPASNGLGAPDKFRNKVAKAGKDAFKTTGAALPSKSAGDAFALKAKPAKPLPAPAAAKQPKTRITPPLKPAVEKLAKPKLSKSALVKQPTTPAARTAPLTPVQPAQARPQKMTAPPSTKPVAKLTKGATGVGSGLKDPFGRKDAKTLRQKALVPAASAGPLSPMTRPSAKSPFAKPPSPPPQNRIQDELARVASPESVERPVAPEVVPDVAPDEARAADAARAPLQIVANESVLDHTGFRKFRRAARSSSLVLVSGAAADAVASADPHAAVVPEADPEADHVSTILTTTGDSDTLIADKPVNPPVSPATPAPSTETVAAPTSGDDGPAPMTATRTAEPAPPPPPPEAATPEPAPEVIAAASAPLAEAAKVEAEKPVEVVEATVEPPSSSPYDTASVPADQLASGPKRKSGAAGTAGAVETSWQAMASGQAAEGQPAAAVLRKVETSPVAGYWDGATAGAKSALTRRGFNQDDIFGVVFGLAVLAFLLLWFVRGRGEETPAGDLLATPQSVTGQSLAAMPPPAPAPKVDPFGNAPVNLKPTGPIPDAAPGDPQIASVAPPAATPAPAAPVTASPPVSAANPPVAIPIADRKMHAWFCTASSRMTKSSRTELKGQLAKFEDVFAGKELIVRGYADTRGSTVLNADLGSRRAQTVADYLTAKGLSVVDVQGVGELDGLDDNQNCSNQRRVDVWVKGGPAETPSRECAPEPDVEALVCG